MLASPLAARQGSASEPGNFAESLAGNYLAGLVAAANRDAGAAASFYREALRADPRNRDLLERAFVAMLADGEVDEAMQLAERLIAGGGDGLANLALGVRALRNGQYQTARRHLANGGRGRAADVTSTLLTAWTWVGSGDLNRAMRTLDRLGSEQAFALFRDYHAARIADIAGNVPEARKRFQSAHRQEPGTLWLTDARARFEARRGDPQEARRLYEDFARQAPRHPVIREGLAALERGEAQRISSAPRQGAAEALFGLAAAGSRQGDDYAAVIYLRLALWLDPTLDLAIITLADIHERAKQYDKAVDAYRMLRDASPLKRTADIQIGLDLAAAERGEEARAHLEALAKTDPTDIDIWAAIGDVNRAGKRFKEAAEAYERALAMVATPDRSHWTLFYYRGISYERLKQWDKAEPDLQKALELNPDQPLVLNYLGYSWVDQGLRVEEAFKLLRRAVELRPRDGYIVDSLGWAYYRLGRYEDAVRELERAVELRPADPVINDHLGDAYWKVGRRLEAQFQWQHARDLNPEPDDLKKIIDKLANGLPDEPKPAAADVEQPARQPGSNGG